MHGLYLEPLNARVSLEKLGRKEPAPFRAANAPAFVNVPFDVFDVFDLFVTCRCLVGQTDRARRRTSRKARFFSSREEIRSASCRRYAHLSQSIARTWRKNIARFITRLVERLTSLTTIRLCFTVGRSARGFLSLLFGEALRSEFSRNGTGGKGDLKAVSLDKYREVPPRLTR